MKTTRRASIRLQLSPEKRKEVEESAAAFRAHYRKVGKAFNEEEHLHECALAMWQFEVAYDRSTGTLTGSCWFDPEDFTG